MKAITALAIVFAVITSGCVINEGTTKDNAQQTGDNATAAENNVENGEMPDLPPYYDECKKERRGISCFASIFQDARWTEAKCNRLDEPKAVYGCIAGVGQRLATPSVCDRINDTGYVWECYAEVGKKMKDMSVCNIIQNTTIRDSCNWNIGSRLRNTTICNQIESQSIQAKCIMEVGADLEDPQVCDLIRQGGYKAQCLEKAKKWARNNKTD